jgi:competence protein ComEA
MEINEFNQIDLNHAGPEELTALPGVGKSMAERIVAGRPYNEIEEILQVQGLGERTLERIRPFISIEASLGDEPSSVEEETPMRDEYSAAERQSILDRVGVFARTSIERYSISTQVVWFVLLTGALSVFLSMILSLAILAGINRTLNFGRHSAVNEMRTEISQIDTQLNSLAADLASVDQRLKAVEGLSGRMAILEVDFDLIQEDVDQALIVVDQLEQEVTVISKEVDGMVDKVNIFDAFLDGLRTLIVDLFKPSETTPSQ